MEPGTHSHSICSGRQILAGAALSFGGPVVVDTDGPFLELHPDSDFTVSENSARGRSASTARALEFLHAVGKRAAEKME